MSEMFSTNTCFLLTTDLNFRGVLKVSFSSEDVNKSVKYNPSTKAKTLNNVCEIGVQERW